MVKFFSSSKTCTKIRFSYLEAPISKCKSGRKWLTLCPVSLLSGVLWPWKPLLPVPPWADRQVSYWKTFHFLNMTQKYSYSVDCSQQFKQWDSFDTLQAFGLQSLWLLLQCFCNAPSNSYFFQLYGNQIFLLSHLIWAELSMTLKFFKYVITSYLV